MILESKAFAQVAASVGEALAPQAFEKSDVASSENSAVFVGKEIAYEVLYKPEEKLFLLRYCSAENGMPDEKWNTRSQMLFDPADEADASRLTASVIADFTDEVSAKENAAAALAKVKKTRKRKENTVDAVFFFNRLVNLFPELREEIIQERIHYGDVRPVAFSKEHVLPKLEELLQRDVADAPAVKKLGGLFNEIYENGDFDIRSILTFGLANNLSDGAFEALLEDCNKDTVTALKAARAIKDKPLKPEKPKKKKQVSARNLSGDRM